jgi:hypothetical protein
LIEPTQSPATPVVDLQRIKGDLVSAYNIWFAALREFTGKQVGPKLSFLGSKDGCKHRISGSYIPSVTTGNLNSEISDLTVSVVQESKAAIVTHRAGQLEMMLAKSHDHRFILHEVGHTLGLGDLYNKNGPRNVSVMNSINQTNGNLYPDDIDALKYAYCRLHREKSESVCNPLNPNYVEGKFPSFNKQKQQLFESGLELVNEAMDVTFSKGNTPEAKVFAKVTKVATGSPAASAGLRVGDLLHVWGEEDPAKHIRQMELYVKDQNPVLTLERFNPGTKKFAEIALNLSPKGEPLYDKAKPSTAHLEKIMEGSVVIGQKSFALDDSEDSRVIPEGTYLTVNELAGDKISVTYYSTTIWVPIRDVILDPSQKDKPWIN